MATPKDRTKRRGIKIIEVTDHTSGGFVVNRDDLLRAHARAKATQLKPGEDEMAEANALVNGDRQAAYGSPLGSYEAQAKVWSGMMAHKLNADLTAEDVVLLLAAMKLRRQAFKPKRDNKVDTHGYMLVLSHVEEGRKARESSTAPIAQD